VTEYLFDEDDDVAFGRQVRAQTAPGDPAARLARLLGQMSEFRPEILRQAGVTNPATRARNRKRASIKLSMASALLAASLLLAAGVGLGRVRVGGSKPSAPFNASTTYQVANPTTETLDISLAKARQSVTDRAEVLARSGQAQALASLEAVYVSMAIQSVEEASAGASGALRQEALIRLADSFERDDSRFSRLAAETGSVCQTSLVRFATEARRLGALARQRSA
jgi:hypothetical protein